MRLNRKTIQEEKFCGCPPSHSNLHGKKGCTATVVHFRWNGKTYDQIKSRCPCRRGSK